MRNELLDQLKECNGRLEKLLSTSDKVSALQNAGPANTKQTSTLETALKKAWKKSDLLFKALQKAWQCSCQQYHFANLRLEHRIRRYHVRCSIVSSEYSMVMERAAVWTND